MTEHDDPLKTHVSGVFHRAAETYDAVGVDFFSPLAAALVDRAGLREGEAVLDLGCGRGAALFAAADEVGPTGTVLGLDLAPGMVERTAADVMGQRLRNVTVRHGDADHPPARDGGWDAVIASFVLFFLPDPLATAGRVRRVLRPGGRFVISSFEPGDERWSAVEGAVRPYFAGEATVAPAVAPETAVAPAASRTWFDSTASVEDLVRQAGFVDVDTELVEHRNVYRDVDQWLEWTWSAGARQMWEEVPDGRLGAAIAAAREVVASLAERDGTLVERFRVRLTRGVSK